MAAVGEPGYLPYCGRCTGLVRMKRDEAKKAFVCTRCKLETRKVNGEDMFDRTAPIDEAELLKKADAAMAPILANGGKLDEKQASKFNQILTEALLDDAFMAGFVKALAAWSLNEEEIKYQLTNGTFDEAMAEWKAEREAG